MPSLAFSPTEAAAFVELSERRVRKEIEHGLLKRQAKKRPRVDFDALVYLQAVRLMELELRVDDRMKVLESIRNALAHATVPESIELSSVLRLALGRIVRELSEKVEAFNAWKQKLSVSEEVLGGEPVFPDSRLAVRRVGGLVERGEAVEAILDDYPYLDDNDVKFAALYTRAYPRVGRPRESRQAAAR